MAADRSTLNRPEKGALGDITSLIVKENANTTQASDSTTEIRPLCAAAEMCEDPETLVGTQPTMTVAMHDHEAVNSCSCMEENK